MTGRGMWWCTDGSTGPPPDTRGLPAGVAGEFLADGSYVVPKGAPATSAAAAEPPCRFYASGDADCSASARPASKRAGNCLFAADGELRCAGK